MNIQTELFIAFRYLKARKKGFFAFLTTLIAVGGTTLGVAALVITLSVMSGFQRDIRSKILGIQPHIVVTRVDGEPFKEYEELKNALKEKKEVKSASPFIYSQGIVRSLGKKDGGESKKSFSTGLIVKAVNFKDEDDMVGLSNQIRISDISFDGLKDGEIILGNEIAKSIAVTVGDQVVLMFPTEFGTMPKMYKFKVVALFHSGMYDFDSSLGYMDLSYAQKIFFMSQEVSGMSVQTTDFDKAVETAANIQREYPYPYRVKAWIEMNKNLFSALKLEKIMMFLILGLIILVAAFNIISNLLLLSVQKSKEIGIMAAVGFSKFSIAKIFFYEGLIVGLLGTVLGLITGLGISLILKYFEIFKLPHGIYYVDRLPIAIIPSDVFSVAVCAFIITVIAGIYPAYQVSKLDPLEAIRYG